MWFLFCLWCNNFFVVWFFNVDFGLKYVGFVRGWLLVIMSGLCYWLYIECWGGFVFSNWDDYVYE